MRSFQRWDTHWETNASCCSDSRDRGRAVRNSRIADPASRRGVGNELSSASWPSLIALARYPSNFPKTKGQCYPSFPRTWLLPRPPLEPSIFPFPSTSPSLPISIFNPAPSLTGRGGGSRRVNNDAGTIWGVSCSKGRAQRMEMENVWYWRCHSP